MSHKKPWVVGVLGMGMLIGCARLQRSATSGTPPPLEGRWRSEAVKTEPAGVVFTRELKFIGDLFTLATSCAFPDGKVLTARATVKVEVLSDSLRILENRAEAVRAQDTKESEKAFRECRSRLSVGSLPYEVSSDRLTLRGLEPELELTFQRVRR